MEYQKIKSYLRNNLQSPSLNFDWTQEDNDNFFSFVRKNASPDFLTKKENLLKVREAFAFYFQPVGYIIFKINSTQVRIKVFPYNTEAKKSKNVAEIVNIIDNNKNSIIKDYHDRDDQIYIKGDLRDLICDYTKTITDEKVNSKELVRFSVRKAFELKDEDLIMLKHDCIFVKLCDISKRRNPVDEEQGGIANRFNGISEEEMVVFNKEHFSSKTNRVTHDFFIQTAKLFIEKYFFEKSITNQDYEKKVFRYIQLIITDQLMNMFDNCEIFFKGFAGYIFRIHFEEVFKNISELMLAEMVNANEYVVDFLKYYSLNVIVVDGKKYQVPSIETDGGLKWNVATMLSIARVYTKANSRIIEMQDTIEKKDFQMIEMCIDGLTPVEYNNDIEKEKKELVEMLLENDRKLEKEQDSLRFIKDENEKNEIKETISAIKRQNKILKDEKKLLQNRFIKRIEVNKFIALDKELNMIERALHKEEKILEQNKDSFESMRKALTKALISKKHII